MLVWDIEIKVTNNMDMLIPAVIVHVIPVNNVPIIVVARCLDKAITIVGPTFKLGAGNHRRETFGAPFFELCGSCKSIGSNDPSALLLGYTLKLILDAGKQLIARSECAEADCPCNFVC